MRMPYAIHATVQPMARPYPIQICGSEIPSMEKPHGLWWCDITGEPALTSDPYLKKKAKTVKRRDSSLVNCMPFPVISKVPDSQWDSWYINVSGFGFAENSGLPVYCRNKKIG
jgi:hypothetical protein